MDELSLFICVFPPITHDIFILEVLHLFIFSIQFSDQISLLFPVYKLLFWIQ